MYEINNYYAMHKKKILTHIKESKIVRAHGLT